MIFSKLFQPKHKHKDPLVRIQAIDALTSEDAANKSILHELAFNDSDSRVSVAALNKLNNFDLWWKMMEIAKEPRMAKHARTKVEEALLGGNDVEISDKARKSFILECKNSSLLETLIQKSAIDENDTALTTSSLRKINKPQLTLRILINTENEALQTTLFEEIRGESDLNKIIKKASNQKLVELATNRINAMKEAKEKPLLLEKEVKLVLSKLLALTDEADFQKFVELKTDLAKQFEIHKQQFAILEDAVVETFTGKFSQIEEKLVRKAQMLKGDWDAQQELERTSAALKSAREKCEAVLRKVSEALTSRVEEITLGDLEQFNDQISGAEDDLNEMLHSKLTEAEFRGIEQLINKLMASRTSLDSLPALQQALSQANEMLGHFKDLSLPDDVSQIEAAQSYLDEIRDRWKDLKSNFKTIWPDSLEKDWRAQISEWQKSLSQLRKDLNESVSKVRGKLNGIGRAIDNGRFKNAMRTYDSARAEYLSLPEGQQARLARQFEKIKEQIENLKDWQEYIAAPKKPELLRELEQVVLNPIDPEAQAERVKELRKEWNSLGVADTETDEVLNNAFNLACEEAFKPCREFYAVQEKHRENNLKAKQSLLQELAAVSQDNIVELSKSLRNMQNKWKEVGSVDYKFLDELNEQYKKIVNPIKDKVNNFHSENAEQKKQLLSKAEGLLSLDDWKDATDTAKQLQGKWRDIGFAGQRMENKLWAEFRSINDKLFAKREEALNEQAQADIDKISEIQTALETKAEEMENSTSRSEIESFVSEDLKSKIDELQQFPKKLNSKAFNFAQKLKQKLEEKLLYLGDSERAGQYQTVFDVLQSWKNDMMPEAVEELPNFWRQAFYTSNSSDTGLAPMTRQELTVLMELLEEKDTPEEDAEVRKNMQLQLMTLKLQDGINLELDELLRAWIAVGAINKADVELLPRVKAIFGL